MQSYVAMNIWQNYSMGDLRWYSGLGVVCLTLPTWKYDDKIKSKNPLSVERRRVVVTATCLQTYFHYITLILRSKQSSALLNQQRPYIFGKKYQIPFWDYQSIWKFPKSRQDLRILLGQTKKNLTAS